MGVMKDLYVTIHNGGDEAVAAVQRMGDDWRAQLEQAAAEIERLRALADKRGTIAVNRRREVERLRTAIRRIAEQDATLSVVSGNVIVEMDATLTDAERALLVMLADHPNTHELFPEDVRTLRGLLDRLGHQ